MDQTSKAKTVEPRKEYKLLSSNSTFEIRKHLLKCFQTPQQQPKLIQEYQEIEVQSNKPLKKLVKLIASKEGRIKLTAKDENIPKLVSAFQIFKRTHQNNLVEEHEIVIKKRKTDNGWEELSMEIPISVKCT